MFMLIINSLRIQICLPSMADKQLRNSAFFIQKENSKSLYEFPKTRNLQKKNRKIFL